MARRHRDSVETTTDADDPDATVVPDGDVGDVEDVEDLESVEDRADVGDAEEGSAANDPVGNDADADAEPYADADADPDADADAAAQGGTGDEAGEDDEAGRGQARRSGRAARFWADAGIAPVEIALPRGVGLTLRHYRTVTDEDGDSAEEAVFLATERRLHLFRSADGLVAFVRSDAEHDLTEVEGWDDVVDGIEPDLVTPDDEDRYELDLVVENLRGGRDVWEPDLLIGAGEVARDVGFACGLEDVLAALAPGSPLDSLDDALRDGGFLARRRLRRISPDQAALAWRSVIGKLSMAVEWHD